VGRELNIQPLQIDTQLLDTLESTLGRLAARWRGTQDAADEQESMELHRLYTEQ
jgi:hypothetical protein